MPFRLLVESVPFVLGHGNRDIERTAPVALRVEESQT